MPRRKKDLSVIDFFDIESPESNEFRRVLHNLNGAPIGGGERRAVLVTSAMLSEGKSLICSFLAMTSARFKNRKTLLIDFDLRRPMIHKLFSVNLQNGVSDILTEGIASRNVIKQTALENLDLLTAGKVMSNPSELLSSTAIHRIIEEMKFYYELILVDSPPLLPVLDPMILLEEMDGVLIVVKAGETQRDIVVRARDILAAQKDKVVGVVVNNLKQSLPYHYNYGYYGYHHKPTKQ
ncbi:MAG: CpsD/CapB family tyrosine-protein kinase [Candidatus Zixiibacteriota bacterium]|nr:MAG: CpsD/CapB family tyrosine-protein kinase [candidate division Zixibacteria bacterium]